MNYEQKYKKLEFIFYYIGYLFGCMCLGFGFGRLSVEIYNEAIYFLALSFILLFEAKFFKKEFEKLNDKRS